MKNAFLKSKTPQEYDEVGLLKQRGGKAYSAGHQRMYDAPCSLLAGANCRVLEIGYGIGFGLSMMQKRRVFSEYWGTEIDCRCHDYVMRQVPESKLPTVTLVNSSWEDASPPTADHGFCIEVIEHVPPVNVPAFLAKARRHIKDTFWISTPESDRSSHGVYTASEMKQLLNAAGFHQVCVINEQWTTLYIAQ